LRIASICSSGSAAKIALPTPDACSGTRLPSLTIVRIISRHCTWSMNTASVPSRIAEVRRLARLLHQPPHVRMALRDESRGSTEARAHRERLQPTYQRPELAGLVDVAIFSSVASSRCAVGRRQLTRVRDVGQREAAFRAARALRGSTGRA
jgi:hypothetical protein